MYSIKKSKTRHLSSKNKLIDGWHKTLSLHKYGTDEAEVKIFNCCPFTTICVNFNIFSKNIYDAHWKQTRWHFWYRQKFKMIYQLEAQIKLHLYHFLFIFLSCNKNCVCLPVCAIENDEQWWNGFIKMEVVCCLLHLYIRLSILHFYVYTTFSLSLSLAWSRCSYILCVSIDCVCFSLLYIECEESLKELFSSLQLTSNDI